MKKIEIQYFNELKNYGSTVPRNRLTGEVIPFKVGSKCTIGNKENKERLNVVCTQDRPYCIKIA